MIQNHIKATNPLVDNIWSLGLLGFVHLIAPSSVPCPYAIVHGTHTLGPPSSQPSGSYQETWKAKHHYADAHKDEVIKHHGHGCVWMSSAKTSGSLKHGSPQPSSANSAECDDEPSSSQKDKNLEQM